MMHPTPRIEHVVATAAEWGLSQPKKHGEDDRKRPLSAVATDLNGRLKHSVFASKEVIESGFGNAGGLADFPHRRGVVASNRKQIECSAEDEFR